MSGKKFRLLMLLGALISVFAFVVTASANHYWSTYHWARTSNPFTVQLGDNVSAAWDSYLVTANADWNASSVLNTVIVAGRSTSRCKATAGRVEVCNGNYGQNGWLGLAQIWLSNGHISQGTAKMNDTYFNMATYNTPALRALVMCQEVGHTFGLGHQDEDNYNTPLGSCMDYSANAEPNQHPNAHDYDLLQAIYAHFDTSTSAFSTIPLALTQADYDAPGAWGRQIASTAAGATFERDFGNGTRLVTHVFYAWEHVNPHRIHDDHD